MFQSIEYLYSLFIKHPHIFTDTRNVSQGSIFFALKGENFNANKFAEDAIKNGSSYAVIDEPEYKKNDNYILVENVLDTLQQLAAWHRKQLTIPIIGITGTNGKTTTKELIFSVLSKKYNTSATKGNFNNHIGVPLSILDISKNIDIAIIEMGANHIGEIGELCKIALPDFGIITNIGKAHIEGFGSLEGIVNTKKELYDSVRLSHGKVFVCKDSSLLLKLSEDIERLTYGVFPDSDCRGEIEESNPLLKVKWYCKSEKKVINISTKLVGYFNFENVMAAICVGEYFGVCSEDIKNAIENYTPSNNRSQFIKTKKNTIIMDAYNANPSSMEASVRNFLQNSFDNKLAIIGDMLELGVDAEKEHKKIIDLLENSDLNKVLLVGKHFSELKISKKFTAFPGVNEAAEWIAKEGINGYNILIKGSRGIKLEKLLELL